MHFDGSGNAVRDQNFGTDAANNVPISSTNIDSEFNGIATCLSDCVTRDGQSPPTADVPMGGHKLTGLAVGTASGDAATFGQLQSTTRPTNILGNPGFKVWQKGTSIAGTAAGLYSADCWFARRDGIDLNFTVSQVAAASVLGCKVLRNNATAQTTDIVLAQSIDAQDTNGLTVGATSQFAFTCSIVKGANFSGTGVKVDLLWSATGQANPITGAGWTNFATTTVLAASLSAATETQITLGADTGQQAPASIAVRITFQGPSGSAGADDSITIRRCALIKGSTSGASYSEVPFQQDLAYCERFYEKSYNYGVNPGAVSALGQLQEGNRGQTSGSFGAVSLRTRKAKTPTMTLYSPATGSTGLARDSNGADVAASANNIGDSRYTMAITGALGASTDTFVYHYVADATY